MQDLSKFLMALCCIVASPCFAKSHSHHSHDKHKTIVVKDSIQEAVNKAKPGDTIRIPAGTYREQMNPLGVAVRIPIHLKGLTIDAEEGAILDASGFLDGIACTPALTPLPTTFVTPDVPCPGPGIKDLTIKGLTVLNASLNGILLVGATDFKVTHCTVESSGQYGIFPQCCNRGIISHCSCSGHVDAGIYVGTDKNICVQENTAFNNVIGIEFENSINCNAQFNSVFNNTAGILCDLEPNTAIKKNAKILIAYNDVHDNNRPGGDPNFLGAIDVEVLEALTPTGVTLFGSGPFVVAHNTIYNHEVLGAIFIDIPLRWWGHEDPSDPVQPRDRGVRPEKFIHDVTFVHNTMFNNGAVFGAGAFDFLLSTQNNPSEALCFDETNSLTSGTTVPTSALSFPIIPKLPFPFRDSNTIDQSSPTLLFPSVENCHIPEWAKDVLGKHCE